MDIDKYEINDDGKLNIEVIINDEYLSNFVNEKLNILYNNFEIKGYRKGHAPKEEFNKVYNKEVVISQYFNELAEIIYKEILISKKFTPIKQADVDIISSNPLKIKFVVDIIPPIKLSKSIEEIQVYFKKTIVDDKDVELLIKKIQHDNPILISINEPYDGSDNMDIKYVFKINNDAVVDIDDSIFLDESDNEIKNIKEFLKNCKKGDVKKIKLIKNEEKKDGLIEVIDVYKKELAVLDDNFPKKVLNLDYDLNTYKNKLKEYMQSEAEQKDKNTLNELILEEILNNIVDFKCSKEILKEQKDIIQNSINEKLIKSNISLESYLKSINKDISTYNEDLNLMAIKQTKIQSLFYYIVTNYNITVDDNDVQNYIEKVLSYYDSKDLKNKMREFMQSDNQRNSIKNNIIVEKIFDFLKQKVIIVDK